MMTKMLWSSALAAIAAGAFACGSGAPATDRTEAVGASTQADTQSPGDFGEIPLGENEPAIALVEVPQGMIPFAEHVINGAPPAPPDGMTLPPAGMVLVPDRMLPIPQGVRLPANVPPTRAAVGAYLESLAPAADPRTPAASRHPDVANYYPYWYGYGYPYWGYGYPGYGYGYGYPWYGYPYYYPYYPYYFRYPGYAYWYHRRW